MPTYEYQCTKCGKVFEVFQLSPPSRSAGSTPTARSATTAPPVRRLIGTGAGIIFKGSGFYETDYRSDGYKSAAKAERDARSKGHLRRQQEDRIVKVRNHHVNRQEQTRQEDKPTEEGRLTTRANLYGGSHSPNVSGG